jgi:hypothetical protein
MDNENLIKEQLLQAIREIFQNPTKITLQKNFIKQFADSKPEVNLISKFLSQVSADGKYILTLSFDSREQATEFLVNETKQPAYKVDCKFEEKVNSITQNIDSYFTDGKYIIPLFELKFKSFQDESSIDILCLNNFFSFHKTIIQLNNKL